MYLFHIGVLILKRGLLCCHEVHELRKISRGWLVVTLVISEAGRLGLLRWWRLLLLTVRETVMLGVASWPTQWAAWRVATQVGGSVGGRWAVVWGSDRARRRGLSVGWRLRGTRISGGTRWGPVGRGSKGRHALLFGEPVGTGGIGYTAAGVWWHLGGRWGLGDVVPIMTRPAVVIRVAIGRVTARPIGAPPGIGTESGAPAFFAPHPVARVGGGRWGRLPHGRRLGWLSFSGSGEFRPSGLGRKGRIGVWVIGLIQGRPL